LAISGDVIVYTGEGDYTSDTSVFEVITLIELVADPASSGAADWSIPSCWLFIPLLVVCIAFLVPTWMLLISVTETRSESSRPC